MSLAKITVYGTLILRKKKIIFIGEFKKKNTLWKGGMKFLKLSEIA